MTSLVIGASGFLGSTLTRRLVDSGEDVRILVRPSSDTRTIDDLDVDRHVGELTHADTLADAMSGCTDVYHCAVDTRAWLLDPAPLYETNVELLRSVLEVAARIPLRRFVFTSTMATIGIPKSGLADENTEFNWDRRATDYVRSRVAAERLALGYAREHAVPLVAMCVSNTYGAGDAVPTPHGSFVAGAALGKLPFGVRGMRCESVGIDDAADALVLAAERGRNGERYIVSERSIDLGEVIRTAAATAGRAAPRPVLGRAALYAAGAVGSAKSTLTRTPGKLRIGTVRLMHCIPEMSHDKAVRELGWQPRPVTEAIAEGARYWVERAEQRRRRTDTPSQRSG
ncbi:MULTISPECIES: NAD-dependent epimerase/dehydratase family protein [Gordonia]|uniref:NAD-dependent epimerase/dehydratase family protein n=1 Tax=Gordonia sputi NBRC 100414 TaxID=1089453 RepID=H5U1V9_9ACTN|nr:MULTISPECIES: NAD-dependent epimerase/dehydratase family protein [Gordonia]NKY92027.1 NAD-dependent epimerase/dehydratase family protein [Gordonia sputi]OBC05943.1 epimerase [Gordonia sp. 852002-50395_SCH5434458]GAB39717.1 NAD-dependent epimerase/dehydratase family protein [Gordonia sputi NBRC 100414]